MRLSPETIDQILDAPEDAWPRLTQEIVTVIDLALRTEIRDTNVDEVKARLPAYVAIDLNEQQTQLVSQIAQNFVIPIGRATMPPPKRLGRPRANRSSRASARSKPGKPSCGRAKSLRVADRGAGCVGTAPDAGRLGSSSVMCCWRCWPRC